MDVKVYVVEVIVFGRPTRVKVKSQGSVDQVLESARAKLGVVEAVATIISENSVG